jgi:hypothetical protein
LPKILTGSVLRLSSDGSDRLKFRLQPGTDKLKLERQQLAVRQME